MTDQLKPKRTRRTKAQIAADELAKQTVLADASAEEAKQEAFKGDTTKGRVVTAILSTVNDSWEDLPREFTINVSRTDTTVKASVAFSKVHEVKHEIALKVTPSLL